MYFHRIRKCLKAYMTQIRGKNTELYTVDIRRKYGIVFSMNTGKLKAVHDTYTDLLYNMYGSRIRT